MVKWLSNSRLLLCELAVQSNGLRSGGAGLLVRSRVCACEFFFLLFSFSSCVLLLMLSSVFLMRVAWLVCSAAGSFSFRLVMSLLFPFSPVSSMMVVAS